MKKILTFFTIFLGLIAPIELCIIILMGIMGIDTLVKLISIKVTCKKDNRYFRDVFKSRMLRQGYIYKGAGYLIFAGAIYPLDYFMLTPFVELSTKLIGWSVVIPTKAIFTNLLLVIFSIIELSSINENWFDITGNNILKSVFKTVKNIRYGVESTVSFIRKTKIGRAHV